MPKRRVVNSGSMEAMSLLPPPLAKRRALELSAHGHHRSDPYHWLRDRSDPEVIAYLEAENAYAAAVTAGSEPLQGTLFGELKARLFEDEATVPVGRGGYLYYLRYRGDYPLYARKPGPDAPEEVLLDVNRLAAQHAYVQVGLFKVSPDGTKLAYTLDTDGGEAFVLHVRDLATGETLEQISGVAYSLEWAADSRALFYTVQDATKRAHALRRHRLGEPSYRDATLYLEPEATFRVSLGKTKDGRYLVLHTGSFETSELLVLSADRLEEEPQPLKKREPGVRIEGLEHREGRFYLLTNAEAPHYRLVTAPVEAPGDWQDLVLQREGVRLEGFDLFQDYLCLYEREQGLRRLGVLHFSSGALHPIPFPEEVYTFLPGYLPNPHAVPEANPNFEASRLRLTYSSLVTPPTVYDLDLHTGELELLEQRATPGYDASAYHSERFFALAEDGAHIPISLVYRKGLLEAGPAPCLLYGYGSYGIAIEPGFLPNRLSLLDRGFIFAIAHVRGGGELGRSWYEDGKFLKKENTFKDFIACAKALVNEGYTSPERLAVMGRSAGGLLIGGVLNQAPGLCKAAVAGVPFVDVVTTMLDSSIPLTVGEYEEWGDPNDERFYHYLLGYSPYDNVRAQDYPSLLVTAGLNDPRVAYWEPAKWVAKLRSLKTDANPLLLKTHLGAGHAGSSSRYENLKETALEYAFILRELGLDEAGAKGQSGIGGIKGEPTFGRSFETNSV